MSLLSRLFADKRSRGPDPTAEEVAAVDIDVMIGTAGERGAVAGEAARLFRKSEGPVDEQSPTARRPR